AYLYLEAIVSRSALTTHAVSTSQTNPGAKPKAPRRSSSADHLLLTDSDLTSPHDTAPPAPTMLELGLVKTGLRGLQLLWCLLSTALIGNVIASSTSASSSATAAVNFS